MVLLAQVLHAGVEDGQAVTARPTIRPAKRARVGRPPPPSRRAREVLAILPTRSTVGRFCRSHWRHWPKTWGWLNTRRTAPRPIARHQVVLDASGPPAAQMRRSLSMNYVQRVVDRALVEFSIGTTP